MRRAGLLLLVLAAATQFAPQAHAGAPAGPRLVVSSGAAWVGETTSVKLEATDIAAPGLAAWSIDLTLDSALLSVEDCEPYQGAICNTSLGPNSVRVTGAKAYGIVGSPVLATLELACVHPGVSPLLLTVGTFADGTVGDPRPIPAAVVNGEVRCTLAGDANCDGVTDPLDALLILQYYAGLLDLLFCPGAADVDGSGRIDSVDALLVLQYYAGLLGHLPP